MNDLLTTRQVQDILKVDRITVYRMLQDGRLKGVKIGQQWRFPINDVERLVGVPVPTEPAALADPDPNFPAHCVQTIQDLFAEVAQISAVVIDMQGRPLTETSRPTRFCELLMATPAGLAASRAAWRDFAAASAAAVCTGAQPTRQLFTCPAGFQYVGAPIFDQDTQVGLFLAGQFYWQPPDPREAAERVRRLAAAYGLPLEPLQQAASEIRVIEPALHAQVENWPAAAARAVTSILRERSCFIERLQQIASLTQLA